MKLKVPDYISAIKPYVPGKPIEALEREYGISESVKLASNENPIGPSPFAVKRIEAELQKLHRYPDGAGHELVHKIAGKLNIGCENIVIGNGSDDIIALLARALLLPGDAVVLPHPSFLMYDITARAAGVDPVAVPLKDFKIDLDGMLNAITDKTRMIFICNPNNPTGTAVSQSAFNGFIKKVPEDILVIIDEAYIEFATDPDCLRSVEKPDFGRPVVTLRTFSKIYGLAGLRVGYGVMPKDLAELVNRVRQPFNVNSLAQAAASAALDDEGFLNKTIETVHQGLDYLYGEMDRLGLDYHRTQTNFFLIDVKKSADAVFEGLLQKGVIARSMSSYGYPGYIRVNAGLPEENLRFVTALENVLKP